MAIFSERYPEAYPGPRPDASEVQQLAGVETFLNAKPWPDGRPFPLPARLKLEDACWIPVDHTELRRTYRGLTRSVGRLAIEGNTVAHIHQYHNPESFILEARGKIGGQPAFGAYELLGTFEEIDTAAMDGYEKLFVIAPEITDVRLNAFSDCGLARTQSVIQSTRYSFGKSQSDAIPPIYQLTSLMLTANLDQTPVTGN